MNFFTIIKLSLIVGALFSRRVEIGEWLLSLKAKMRSFFDFLKVMFWYINEKQDTIKVSAIFVLDTLYEVFPERMGNFANFLMRVINKMKDPYIDARISRYC